MQTNVDHLSTNELRASREAWWSVEFDDFLWATFGDIAPGPILDLGCGIGTFGHRLGPRLPLRRIVGADLDYTRLALATQARNLTPTHTSYITGDGLRLPFAAGSFAAAIVVLTLQHVPHALSMLGEMRRVTRTGGSVIAAEADNCGQRLYLPGFAPELDAAVEAFWLRVWQANRPSDIAIGPRLPELFQRAGIRSASIRGFLLTSFTWHDDPLQFGSRARERFRHIARTYGVDDSVECNTLLNALRNVVAGASTPFYSISTVPLFLSRGYV